ncbi:MAG: DUF2723 domain-containing protein [Bacteroidales bacterium]|jgi:hypothetical protein
MSTRLLHPLSAFLVFLTSLITYALCLEPSVSWWDCGEFISSAYRLEIGHPPGAPLFNLLGRFFTLFASGPEQVARMVNLMSAFASALTVMFLYLTIVMLAQKAAGQSNRPKSTVLFSSITAGVIGALVYAFSDTFWFSAVEGEVYALSSLFTAAVFWAILKWESEADEPGNLRWIVLIAFLTGLSIGVHLLNLLAIPSVVLIWYFRKNNPATLRGILLAIGFSLLLLGFVMYGLIPGVVILASWFELFFVNLVRMPYNSGLIVFVSLAIGLLVWGIRRSHKRNSAVCNTVLVSLVIFLTGYSSYIMLPLRSKANPLMDQNNPDNVFSLISYLNREQYGDRPLLLGPSFNAPLTGQKPGKGVYSRIEGRYKLVDRIYEPVYDKRFRMVFPRMWNSSAEYVQLYKQWGRIKGRPIEVKDLNGKFRLVYKPTFTENLRFFFNYQLGHMYFRYFMWNFAGRQNDTESQGGIRNGNWISGIRFLDEARLGPQDALPDRDLNSKSRNTYYLLPLLLGLTGAIYLYRKSPKNFLAVLLLFIFTGIAIVVYLNQYPNQPRERDYSYAGSFYAFAVMVGMGGAALMRGGRLGKFVQREGVPAFAGMTREGLVQREGASTFAGMTSALLLCVPVLMAVQNWDDHDRSGRYFARDIAYDYLNSCAPNAILFTSGDNDTFPLWYAQEVEGIRTDVRVICLPYLASDWYIDQLKRKAWLSDPVPFTLSRKQYGPGKRDYVPVIEQVKDTVDIRSLFNFVTSDDTSAQVPLQGGGYMNYIPARTFRLPVDRNKVLLNGTVPPEDTGLIVPEIVWTLRRPSIYKNDLMILDLIAHNNWGRPVYFTALGHENILGLDRYFRLEGFAFRLVPVRQADESVLTGSINTGILYDRLMNRFRWGNLNDPSVFIDYNTYRTTRILNLRQRFTDLAEALILEDKPDSAKAVLDRIVKILPSANFPNDVPTAGLAEMYYRIAAFNDGDELLRGYLKDINQDIRYIMSVENRFGSILSEEAGRNAMLVKEIRRLAESYARSSLVQEIDQMINQLGVKSE